MEALLLWLAQWAVSQALGSGVVTANDLRRLHKIKRQAPSAKVVKYQIALTQEDYDRLTDRRTTRCTTSSTSGRRRMALRT